MSFNIDFIDAGEGLAAKKKRQIRGDLPRVWESFGEQAFY